jgi:hypothetical protein
MYRRCRNQKKRRGKTILYGYITHLKYKKMFQNLTTTSLGAALALGERNEQIQKHGYGEDNDKMNNDGELVAAALFCINPEAFKSFYPRFWDVEQKEKLMQKSPKDRLIIAAALLCAEYDRLQAEEQLDAQSPTI